MSEDHTPNSKSRCNKKIIVIDTMTFLNYIPNVRIHHDI